MTKDESWREFKARFPGGMTWRQFLGYIRDDRVMKTRLAVLVAVAACGLATVIASAVGQWAVAAMCFMSMLAVGFVGYNA